MMKYDNQRGRRQYQEGFENSDAMAEEDFSPAATSPQFPNVFYAMRGPHAVFWKLSLRIGTMERHVIFWEALCCCGRVPVLSRSRHFFFTHSNKI